MGVVVVLQHLAGQIIFFAVPLIIIGFVAPSIASLKKNASGMLAAAVVLAYFSSVGAASFSAVSGYLIIPNLSVSAAAGGTRELPELLFRLDIPPVMSVMTALLLAVTVGLAVAWTQAELFIKLLSEFQSVVLSIVNRIVIPVLPFFIGTTFAALAYERAVVSQLPVFASVIGIVIAGQYIWLLFLYGIGGAVSRKNPWRVLRYYGPAYLTALGTMSSAATLPVALSCARKSDALRRDITDFSIPLFSNIHLCGSVLTEVFFILTVSKILYGTLPPPATTALFIVLLGIFAVGAPGVPGGTVLASLGLITGVLGFDEAGTALMLTVFALQDSFGTACNITGDGALTLILSGAADWRGKKPAADP